MAASAASAMASQSQSKKKTKKHDKFQHRLRTSADLHDFVENDKSHVTHFWEAVRTSVHASGHFDRERHSKFKKKMNELEVADSRTNADEIRQKMLFNPESKHKTGWDFLLAILVIYTLISLPLRIAFAIDGSRLIMFDYIIDALFVMDILINFNTSYDATPDNDNDDVLETDRCKIAYEYLKSWFIVDALATIPFDSIVRAAANDPNGNYLSIRLIRIIRLLKLLKFIRVIKLKKILEMLEEVNISAGIVSIVVLVLEILFMCHIICCFWYYMATTEGGADVNRNWVVNTWPEAVANEGMQNVTVVCGNPGANSYPDCKTKSEIYVASFYWVMSTMTTIGYGDIRAYSTSERLYSCFVILCGSIMFGAVITKVTKLIINRNPQATNLKAKMDDLKGYLNEKKLCKHIKEQAIESYIYYMHKKSLISESGVFDEMPKPLLVKLIQSIYQEEIQTIRVFKKYEDNFVVQIVINSMPFQVKAGENVYEKGDLASDVTFIMLGVIGIMDTGNEKTVIKGYCSQGNFFGDTEFLKRSTYVADYHAVHSCNLLSISSQFLSNYLATNIESGLKFTYDIEDRYRKFREVNYYPTKQLRKGDFIHEMVFHNGEIISYLDEELVEYVGHENHHSSTKSSGKHSGDPNEILYRVSREDADGDRIFIEETREEIGRRWVVMHNGDNKMRWDIFIGIFIVYSVCAIPVQISFTTNTPEALYAFETMIDLLFGCDILVSSRTTYFDEVNDYVETIPWNMFRHYFKTWFFIDVASTFPFDSFITLILGGGGEGLGSIKMIKFVRLIRIMKMFRLTKLVTLLNKLENTLGVSPAFFQLMQYLMIVILMVHFLSCLWWYASANFTAEPWFAQFDDPNNKPSSFLLNDSVGDQYIASLYFTFTTLATVGYGDLTPIKMEEQLLDSFIMLIGATVFGYLIASIASLLGGLNRTAAISQARINEITAYLTERSAPRDLTKEIVRYFTHMFEQKTAYDEQAILDRIPKTLKHEILLLQYGDILQRISLFDYMQNDSVVLYIFENLVLTYYESNKIILREGNFASNILFLINGIAIITKAKSEDILRKKRFRHTNNRQREFFKTDKIVEENELKDEQQKQISRSAKRTKASSSLFLDRHAQMESSNRMKGEYNPKTIGEENRSAAEEAGEEASGSLVEMSTAISEVTQTRDSASLRKARKSLYQRLTFLSPSMKQRKIDDDEKARVEAIEKNISAQKHKTTNAYTKMKDFYINDPREDITLGELHAGQFCGHVAMMNKGGKHDASVVSILPCTFYSLTRQAIYRILQEQPSVAVLIGMALGEAISDLKMETGNQTWWAVKKTFIKDIHLKHINYKNAGDIPSIKKRNSLTGSLIPIKMPNRMKFTRSFRRAMNVMSKKFSSIVSPQIDTPVEVAVAEARWDRVRRLIKKAKTTAMIAATTRRTSQDASSMNIDYEDGAITPSALESKSTIDLSRVSPSKRLNPSLFSEVLRYDLGSGLQDLVDATLSAPVEELEARETALLPPTIVRRVHSQPVLGSGEVALPREIREGIQLANTVQAQPSTFQMRRRKSFPTSVQDMASWRKDKGYLHVI